jgi:ParB-like nuclease domain
MIDPAAKDIRWIAITDIHPAPENDHLYGPIDPNDPKIQQMAAEMRQQGKCRTLPTVSRDGFVMDGHRRLAAAKLAGLTSLECIIDPMLHSDPQFVRELVRFNNQRIKSNDVLFREAVVSTSKGDAYKRLKKQRARLSATDASDIESIIFTQYRGHNPVSDFRIPFLNAVIKILNTNRRYWPLTDRQIHYLLLNNPPLRHSSKDGRLTRRGTPSQDSTYVNDKESYNAVVRLIKDARLDEHIPWEAIDDPTRPVTIWDVYDSTQPYIESQLDDFLRSYSRNLLQSQANHIELFAEKKTLSTILRPIVSKYCMPMTIGSGCCSISPIKKLAERFRQSGKEKLIVLTIADFDPAGIMIARSFAQRLRDYFGITNVDARRVALTREQIDTYALPVGAIGGNVDDKDDVNKETFRQQFGEDTYEVEALAPSDLESVVEDAILQTIHVDAYNHEIEREEKDSQFLEAKRNLIMEYAESLPVVAQE